MSEVRLLSPPSNFAVVHLPGRHFPGVVIQGDSLNNLIGVLESAIAETDPQEREDCLAEVLGQLRAARSRYEDVLQEVGLTLPNSTSPRRAADEPE